MLFIICPLALFSVAVAALDTSLSRSLPVFHTPKKIDSTGRVSCGIRDQKNDAISNALNNLAERPKLLARCTEPLASDAVDMRGIYQGESLSGDKFPIFYRYEQCGDRLVITSDLLIWDQRVTGKPEHGTNDVFVQSVLDLCEPYTAVWSWSRDADSGNRTLIAKPVDGYNLAIRYRFVTDGLIHVSSDKDGNPFPMPPVQRRLDDHV